MYHMIDYLEWRGDITLEQNEINPVDALILSELSYLRLKGLVPEDPKEAPTVAETAQMLFELPEEAQKGRCRDERDLILLKALGESCRFGSMRLTFPEERTDETAQIQFAALTVLLADGDAFAVFRGTDGSLVGWKEDFNLGFMDSIPGQWAARDYLERTAEFCPGELFAAGHSKGGNLAVFAAAKCSPDTRRRICGVYNNDGPGFSSAFLEDEGYQEILGRIHTFVPQSSVVGMLLEHEEPYTVVKSSQAGLLQHEPYSWEVRGGDFVRLKQVTEGSRMIDQTVKSWLSGLTREERESFVDAVYELLRSADVDHIGDLAHPERIYAVLQKLGQEDSKNRQMLLKAMVRLVAAAARTVREFQTRDTDH